LLATGPLVGVCWGAGLVTAQVWTWPVPRAAAVGFAAVLITVAGVLLVAGTGTGSLRRTRLGVARSFQIPRPFHSMTVLENLLVPSAYVIHLRDSEGEAKAMEILRSIRLADKAHALANQLSQVELRKLELARAMAAEPRLLISDEAMAGLAGAEVDEVLQILFDLNAKGITIIMIEHIMQAVMRFSQRVVCLDAGRIICEGTPQTIVGNADVQKAYLGA